MHEETPISLESTTTTEAPLEVSIREALPMDSDGLVRLIVNFNLDSQFTMPEAQYKMREYKDAAAAARDRVTRYLSDPKYSLFVAESAGKLAGYISGTIYERPERIYDREGYLENWVIDDEFQSKGIGKKLYDRLEKVFIDANCSHITVGTHVQNSRALEIYEHLGYLPRLQILSKPLK